MPPMTKLVWSCTIDMKTRHYDYVIDMSWGAQPPPSLTG